MSSPLTIAQLQLSVLPDKARCLDQMAAACARAAGAGADLIALPEMFCCPYAADQFAPYAEEEGGPAYTACARVARDLGVWLSAGSLPERAGDGRLYNTAYVFDRQGRRVAKHRKVHLFDIDVRGGQQFQESATLSAGDHATTFDTEFGPMGLCICYDFRFPELGRLMALAGARVILVPAAFNLTTGPAHWELMFRSQAVNNQCFTVGTAPARDLSASYHSWGHSMVADPWGRVVSQLEEGPDMAVTTVDLDLVEDIRAQLPLLRHRRTDLYQLTDLSPAK